MGGLSFSLGLSHSAVSLNTSMYACTQKFKLHLNSLNSLKKHLETLEHNFKLLLEVSFRPATTLASSKSAMAHEKESGHSQLDFQLLKSASKPCSKACLYALFKSMPLCLMYINVKSLLFLSIKVQIIPLILMTIKFNKYNFLCQYQYTSMT